jgi:hypothetical protein
VLIAALVGLVRLTVADARLGVVLASFPIVFLAFISNTVAASRYVTPITPVLALFAAFALSRTALRAVTDVRRVRLQPDENAEAGQPNQDAARQNQSVGLGTGPPKGGPYVRVAILVRVAIVVALALPGFMLSVRLGRFFGKTDTRTVAQRWIEENVPPGATVLVQPYSVQLTQSRESLVEALSARIGDVERASTKFAIRLGLDPWPALAYRTLYLGDGGLDADKIYVSYGELGGSDGLEALKRAHVDYVVLKRYNVEDPAVTPLRSLLQQRARLVATFSPYRPEADARTRAVVPPFQHNTDTPYHVALARPGPGIEVWELKL